MTETEMEKISAGNRRSFSEVVHNEFGRRVILTTETTITHENIVDDLEKALKDHRFNKSAITYLDNYYRGDQPILYRTKKIRADINNKVVENHAYEAVESKVADLYGEPIQYALKVIDESESEEKGRQLRLLNSYMESENKAEVDVEKGRWASICGTSYLFVGDDLQNNDLDEAPFRLEVLSPIDTFVVYFDIDKSPAYSVQIRKNSKGEKFYHIYTNSQYIVVKDGKVVDYGANGNRMIPIIEYPNNARRLSDIELTIFLTDELNKMQSDRMNGIEQFIQAFILFKNAEINKDEFLQLVVSGAIAISDTRDGRQADAKILESQLDQNGTQISKDDVYQNFLIVQGKPGRSESSGGNTGQAVVLMNGYYDEDKRAELRVPTFKKSEREMLKVVLRKLKTYRETREIFTLRISEIDIKPKRSKLENMMVKAQVLQILHQIGVDDEIALKTVNMFSDVQDTYAKSREAMQKQFEYSIGGNDTTEETTDNFTDGTFSVGAN